jgi:hypothetical protein
MKICGYELCSMIVQYELCSIIEQYELCSIIVQFRVFHREDLHIYHITLLRYDIKGSCYEQVISKRPNKECIHNFNV